MSPFEFFEPATFREALSHLEPGDTDVRAMGGGTALMLMMKAGVLVPRRLVSLRRVEPRFSRIEMGEQGELRIGALSSLSSIEHSPLVERAAPVIPKAMKRLSNVRVRNVATIGGNLAHADPHMDMPPILTALDARVLLIGPAGERIVPIDELIIGYYETSLGPGELIGEVIIPSQGNRKTAYFKCTTRAVDDWPALGVAASLDMQGGVVHGCALVVGAATDRPTRLKSSEAILEGSAGDEATLRRMCDAAVEETDLLSDAQGSAPYKRALLRVYLGRAVNAAIGLHGTAGRNI
ncbi:MAG TPA: xanthine dehydrogenase family protein subunit M [Herbaspirillum sp.]|jgi:carbon-monoxide dehydrogenase medium subunit